jgi:hypothetical protein
MIINTCKLIVMNANKWGEVRTNYQEKKNKINHINKL